jgi:hypothetical protein
LLALFNIGVQGSMQIVALFIHFLIIIFYCRCTAPFHDLDGDGYVSHSCNHTELLVEELELGILWDEYGIIGDIVVCIVLFPFTSLISHFLTAIHK